MSPSIKLCIATPKSGYGKKTHYCIPISHIFPTSRPFTYGFTYGFNNRGTFRTVKLRTAKRLKAQRRCFGLSFHQALLCCHARLKDEAVCGCPNASPIGYTYIYIYNIYIKHEYVIYVISIHEYIHVYDICTLNI